MGPDSSTGAEPLCMLCAEGGLAHRVAACSPGASAQGGGLPCTEGLGASWVQHCAGLSREGHAVGRTGLWLCPSPALSSGGVSICLSLAFPFVR